MTSVEVDEQPSASKSTPFERQDWSLDAAEVSISHHRLAPGASLPAVAYVNSGLLLCRRLQP